MSDYVNEVPDSLKRLIRYVLKTFYSFELYMVVNMLLIYPCIREEDLSELLKLEQKHIRQYLNDLKREKFINEKSTIDFDTQPPANRPYNHYQQQQQQQQVVHKNVFYFINYKMMVNIIKYKLDIIRIQIENEEKQCSTRAAFRCLQCKRAYSDLDMRDIFLTMKCIYCGGQVDEDQSVQTNRHTRNLLVKYNTQMEYLFNMLHKIENVRLSNDILNPKPMDISHILNKHGGRNSYKKVDLESVKKWSGDSTRNVDLLKQMKISININEDNATQQHQQQQRQQNGDNNKTTTVDDLSLNPNNTLSSLFDNGHTDMTDDNYQANQTNNVNRNTGLEDNIMKLLLIHEKKNVNGSQSATASQQSTNLPMANGAHGAKRDFVHHISDDDSTAAIIDPTTNEDFFMNEFNANLKKDKLNGKHIGVDTPSNEFVLFSHFL
jgi:transcription initiation factor TFIIE subunit alpha